MAKAQWRNKRAILRDLAKVMQGDVLVNINDAITDNRPPALNINEETEEEYLRFCGDDASTEGPDLYMIRDNLSMMQSIQSESKEQHTDRTVLEISKVTPQSSVRQSRGKSAPSSTSSETRISQSEAEELSNELTMKIQRQPKTVKAKRERNAAIASLLKVHAGVAPIGYVATPYEERPPIIEVKPPVKLLKPDDFTVTNIPPKLQMTTTAPSKPQTVATMPVQQLKNMKKVDRWLKQSPVSAIKGPELNAEAFRFKKSQKVPLKPVEKPKPPSRPKAPAPGQYVPSPYAEQLYRSILQQKEEREAAQKLKEDIWQQASRKMQEADAQRSEAERIRAEIAEVVNSLEQPLDLVTLRLDNGVDMLIPAVVCLPQHRHKLTGTCKVCERCGIPPKTPTEDLGTESAAEILDSVGEVDKKVIPNTYKEAKSDCKVTQQPEGFLEDIIMENVNGTSDQKTSERIDKEISKCITKGQNHIKIMQEAEEPLQRTTQIVQKPASIKARNARRNPDKYKGINWSICARLLGEATARLK